MDLELLKERLNSFLLTWMIEELQKTQLLLGCECTRKAMEVSTRNGAEGKSPPVDGEVRRNQESEGTEENNCRWRWSKFWDGGGGICEHTEPRRRKTVSQNFKGPKGKDEEESAVSEPR